MSQNFELVTIGQIYIMLVSGVAQLLWRKKRSLKKNPSFYCFMSLCYRQSCTLAKESMFSPMSSGELLQVFEQERWLGSYVCFKKIVLATKRRKMARSREAAGRSTGEVLFSRQEVMVSTRES